MGNIVERKDEITSSDSEEETWNLQASELEERASLKMRLDPGGLTTAIVTLSFFIYILMDQENVQGYFRDHYLKKLLGNSTQPWINAD